VLTFETKNPSGFKLEGFFVSNVGLVGMPGMMGE
jgi:hypothetical protein